MANWIVTAETKGGVTNYRLDIDGATVPMIDGEGTLPANITDPNHRFNYWFYGSPGATLSVSIKLDQSQKLTLKGARIPKANTQGGGSIPFKI